MKVKLVLGFVFLLASASGQHSDTSRKKEGRYTAQADSLRKAHKGNNPDSAVRSPKDHMPVVQDTGKSKMPAAVPKSDDKMPVMEMSDTLKRERR